MHFPLYGVTQFSVTYRGYWAYGNKLILVRELFYTSYEILFITRYCLGKLGYQLRWCRSDKTR